MAPENPPLALIGDNNDQFDDFEDEEHRDDAWCFDPDMGAQ